MPIDIDTLMASEPLVWDSSWTERDVILYHLGIGAGNPPDDAAALRRSYERDLQVLPSFAVIPGFCAIDDLTGLPGLDIDLRNLLHSEQNLRVEGPLPTSATAISTLRPLGVYDLRAGASVMLEITTTVDGATVATNTMTVFITGEGDFGGDSPPRERRVRVPKRDPDAVVTTPTLPQQALLYRLSGDRNPIHVDPEFAAGGGFERPILHGLCTFGMAMRAVVDTYLNGADERIAGFRTRFSGVVVPGDSITHRLWETDDGIVVESSTDADAVLKQALVTLR